MSSCTPKFPIPSKPPTLQSPISPQTQPSCSPSTPHLSTVSHSHTSIQVSPDGVSLRMFLGPVGWQCRPPLPVSG